MANRKHPTPQEDCHTPVNHAEKAVQTLNAAADVIKHLGTKDYEFSSKDLSALKKAHEVVHGQVTAGVLSEAEAPIVKKLDWALETSINEGNFSRMKNEEIMKSIKGLGASISRSATTVESACMATVAEAGAPATPKAPAKHSGHNH